MSAINSPKAVSSNTWVEDYFNRCVPDFVEGLEALSGFFEGELKYRFDMYEGVATIVTNVSRLSSSEAEATFLKDPDGDQGISFRAYRTGDSKEPSIVASVYPLSAKNTDVVFRKGRGAFEFFETAVKQSKPFKDRLVIINNVGAYLAGEEDKEKKLAVFSFLRDLPQNEKELLAGIFEEIHKKGYMGVDEVEQPNTVIFFAPDTGKERPPRPIDYDGALRDYHSLVHKGLMRDRLAGCCGCFAAPSNALIKELLERGWGSSTRPKAVVASKKDARLKK